MNSLMKTKCLMIALLIMLMISQTVSAAPLQGYGSGPVNQFVYDNFDDNTMDTTIWSAGQTGGPTIVETNQRLEITFPATSTGQKFDAVYYSACALRGDFDIQVDYELLNWPYKNGVRISLVTDPANMERVSFGAQNDYAGGPDVYLIDYAGVIRGTTGTSDYSGKLRLTRTGYSISGLFFTNGSWSTIWSHSSTVNIPDTHFTLAAWSHDPIFADQEVKFAFDNLIINSGELVCPVNDTTPPVITPTITGTLGQNGWYTSNVALSWSVSDPESAISSTSGCEAVQVTQDQQATNYTCSATSAGGTDSKTVSIARDATAPTITCPTFSQTFSSGQTVTASADAAVSGLNQAASVLTGILGDSWPQTLSFTAVDLAGNTTSKPCTFNTTYTFSGFMQPVDNPGPGPNYIFNSVKAGGAVPVKFSLAGDQGLGIFATGYPISQPASCTTATITDPVEQTVSAGSSYLSYDAASDTYTYVWKTDKRWAGTCRVLNIKFSDGSQYPAYFRFK